MEKDIILISGALATPKLWHHQENYFNENKRFHHLDVLNSDSITKMANRYSLISPDKFTLIGFSMGGYIALELYRLIPHKIEKLILINSAAKLLSEKGKLERDRSIALIDKGKFNFLIKMIFKNSIYDKEKHATLLPIAQKMALEIGIENYKSQLTAILNKPDHTSILPTIKCPTLLLASREDRVMPVERSEHLAKHIENSKLIYVENCGHLATLEQPDKINEILVDWL